MSLSTVYGLISPQGATGVIAANAELNALPNNGIAICSAENWSNIQGDAQGKGYPDTILGRLTLSAPASVYPANAAVYAWILSAWDGTNYPEILNALTSSSGSTATTSTTAPLPNAPDFVWPLNVDSAVQAQIRDAFSSRRAPYCAKNYLVVWNQSGVALATPTTDAIQLYFGTEQIG